MNMISTCTYAPSIIKHSSHSPSLSLSKSSFCVANFLKKTDPRQPADRIVFSGRVTGYHAFTTNLDRTGIRVTGFRSNTTGPVRFGIPCSNLDSIPVSDILSTEKENLCSWLEEHPSALDKFEEMMSTVEKKIVVFLDYDGTLSHIVDDPDRAYMTDAMRTAVNEVASRFPTAIISGRSREKVSEFVKLSNVLYAGSHGMDISTPKRSSKSEDQKHETMTSDEKGNQVVHFHPADKFLPIIKKIIQVLEEKVLTVEGSKIEDNKFCITVHYRLVKNEKDVDILREKVETIMQAYPCFHISRGKKVMEIRPNISWDKGCAVQYLLGTLGYSFEKIMPLYIGDDTTDEDAFKVIRDNGQGFPIIVSSKAKETKASYSLRDPDEVLSFLIRLAEWRKPN